MKNTVSDFALLPGSQSYRLNDEGVSRGKIRRVLGIDPGLANTGFGVVDFCAGRYRMVSYGVISTNSAASHQERLLSIYNRLCAVIDEFKPAEAGMETLYFARNVTSAMGVAEARGVVTLCLAQYCIPLGEYTPNQIKQAVTGTASADKQLVEKYVQILLGLEVPPKPDHAADALAGAITHLHFSPSACFLLFFGTITGKFPKQIFIDTGGVEWDICIPDSNLDMLPPVGSVCRVFTFLQHTETAMQMYGFASADERTLFFDLMKVEGIGAKAAVKIMSSVSSARLMQVLDDGDLEMLEKIPGVGKKTAGKMLLALKGKLSLRETPSVVRISPEIPFNDVVVSLVSMGYDKRLVEQKIAFLSENLQNDASFTGKTQKEKEDALFRRAIVELS